MHQEEQHTKILLLKSTDTGPEMSSNRNSYKPQGNCYSGSNPNYKTYKTEFQQPELDLFARKNLNLLLHLCPVSGHCRTVVLPLLFNRLQWNKHARVQTPTTFTPVSDLKKPLKTARCTQIQECSHLYCGTQSSEHSQSRHFGQNKVRWLHTMCIWSSLAKQRS